MRVSWIGSPQQEDAKATIEAWAENTPKDVQIVYGLDPSCDVLVWHTPESLCATDAKLILRRRFGGKSVLCFHDYDFINPWVAKRAITVCNAAKLLLFWSKQHEQIFRILHSAVITPGQAVSVIAKEDYKKKRRKRRKKKANAYLGEEREEAEEKQEPTYADALKESSKAFWQIIRKT